jgi:hypothetical protein
MPGKEKIIYNFCTKINSIIKITFIIGFSQFFRSAQEQQSPNFEMFKDPKNRFQGTKSARLCSLADLRPYFRSGHGRLGTQ